VVIPAGQPSVAIANHLGDFSLCPPNTTDFRCLWGSGALPAWCSFSVFESVFVMASPECGHAGCATVTGRNERERSGTRPVPVATRRYA